MEKPNNSHSILIGYLLWIFGFMGVHRFYYGKPVTGSIWFCTLGLLGIGWLIDLFLIPSMDREADSRFSEGVYDYSITWILMAWLGIFGAHRMYIGKWASGLAMLIITLSTMSSFWWLPPIAFGFIFVAFILLYDLWTLNSQIAHANQSA